MTQTFGPRFCNVRYFLPEDPWFDSSSIPVSGNQSERFQDLITAFLVRNQGTLYLPTGDYEIQENSSVGRMNRSSLWDGVQHPDLLIPSDVTLMLAPGARLILAPGTVVRIDGMLDAHRLPIFIALPAANGLPRGRVVILSDRIPELCPEWWGAESYESDPANRPVDSAGAHPQAPDTAQCIQDCFDAAHRHRVWPGIERTPIPVLLQSVYRVQSGIVIDDLPNVAGGPRHAQGVIVRGQRGPSTAGAGMRPNLMGGAPFSGTSLITLRGLQGCVFEDVGFLIANDAPTCIVLEGTAARGCTFRACSFSQGVRAPTTSLPWGPLVRSGTQGQPGEDHSGLTFEGCYFSTSNLEEFMVQLHASHSHPVVFDACQFQGRCQGCIRATAGVMLIQDSSFNTGNPLHLDEVDVRPTDVFLDAPSAASTGFAPACVATRIESQSHQFLKTYPDPVIGLNARSLPVVLEGLKQVNVNHPSSPSEGMLLPEPSSVRWGGPGIRNEAQPGAPLVLIGCTFGSAYGDRLNLMPGREPACAVVIDQRVSRVIDVGSRHILGHPFLWQFSPMSTPSYRAITDMEGMESYPWLRRL